MFLHESPAIAPGLKHLMATVPDFAGADPATFDWLRRDADFGGMLRMILGQQVSTQAATAMSNKLALLMPDSDPALFLTLTDEGKDVIAKQEQTADGFVLVYHTKNNGIVRVHTLKTKGDTNLFCRASQAKTGGVPNPDATMAWLEKLCGSLTLP